jgi:CheY-like chemotaxis protein
VRGSIDPEPHRSDSRSSHEKQCDIIARFIHEAARPTVLIVDDSRLMRVAIKKILKDEFELIEAVDGEDAWSRLMEDPAIACIFSDLSMPNLDGYGLLARVRGSDDAHVRALPFIVITGKEGDLGGLLEEVRGHGATDLVGKPFKSDEIIARTRSLLAVDTTPAVVMAAVAETQEAPEASPRGGGADRGSGRRCRGMPYP